MISASLRGNQREPSWWWGSQPKYDMIWYDMIWYDMIYDIWYLIWYIYMIWYGMIWYDIELNWIWYVLNMLWYDMIWYDLIWIEYDVVNCMIFVLNMLCYDISYHMRWDMFLSPFVLFLNHIISCHIRMFESCPIHPSTPKKKNFGIPLLHLPQ